MPHITLEVPARLESRVAWRSWFVGVHQALSAEGYARLDDFKSRVVLLQDWQVGAHDASASFVFATLQTMNPRPAEMLRSMAEIIHRRLEDALSAAAGGEWIQCCVKVASTPPEDYFKSHLNAPALPAGRFSVDAAG